MLNRRHDRDDVSDVSDPGDAGDAQDADGSAGAARSEPRSLGRRAGSLLKELVVVVVLGLVVSTLLRTFVFQMFEIPSESMENTLMIGDRVAVQKITPFQRGDVVVFADPGGWLPALEPTERTPVEQGLEFVGILPNSSDQYLIKRVIGMPGDTVVCCDTEDRLLVNGQPLNEQTYLFDDGSGPVAPSDITFEVTVPADRIFVMGDHRNASADSRCHLSDRGPDGEVGLNAFVPTSDVVGVAFAVTYPFDRFGAMRRPATFDSVPVAPTPAPAEPRIEPAGIVC